MRVFMRAYAFSALWNAGVLRLYGFIYKVKHFTVERSKAVKSIIHLGESRDSLSVVQGSTAVPVDLRNQPLEIQRWNLAQSLS